MQAGMATRSRAWVSAFVACLLVAVIPIPSGAAPISGTPGARLRPDPGPTARYVFGTGAPAGPIARPAITVRGSVARISSTGGAGAPATGADAPPPLAPVVSTHFDAIPRIGSNWPGDPTGAIGELHVVAAVNTQVAVYDRGGGVLLGPRSLSSLASFPSRTQIFDPKVVYDQYEGAFVLVYLAVNDALRRSWISVFTIPDDETADDARTWCGAKLRGDVTTGNGAQWADYPTLGYDANGVTIGTNVFGFPPREAFGYAQLYRIDDAELFGSCVAGDRVVFRPFVQKATRDPDGSKAFTIQPAQTVGPSDGTQFLLSFDASGSDLILWRLRRTTKGLALARVSLRVPRAKVSPFGTQKGGSIVDDDTWWDPGDLRLVNAFYDAALDRIFAAHVVYRDLRPDPITGRYPEAAIRWYEVRPANRLRSSEVTRTGIVGTPETDAGWPTVATDSAGNLWIAYSRASKPKGEYLSAWAAEIPPGSRTAVSTLLTAGTARMQALPGVERWGDFNAAGRDPRDGAFVAMLNQYARSDGDTVTRDWQQTFDLLTDG